MIRSRSAPILLALALLISACGKSDEQKLRVELKTWSGTQYAEKGTSRTGISNAGFVSVLFHDAFGWDIPATRDELSHVGKLVDRKALKPGDLVFLEGQGFGPFRSRAVAIFVGHDEIAIASKETGVAVVKLTEPRWSKMYSTAHHIPRDSTAGTPTFDVAKYGDNTGGLLRDIAKAWTGTLYLDNGTTFDGIGNYEYVRAIYEAIYDTELDGAPAAWAKMGVAVKREDLKPGDIILYQALGLAGILNRFHAGMYIGDGDFTHCMKGSAVTISKLDDPRWKTAFRAARRIDHNELTLQQEARAARLAYAPARAGKSARGPSRTETKVAANPPTATKAPAGTKTPAAGKPSATVVSNTSASRVPSSDVERRLRASTELWRGTPYKLGGESKKGVDCSAFARAIYKESLAVDLPRTAAEQERLGTKIERSSLATGDLVFFRTQGMGPFFKSRHVGVYLGDGEFAQASGSKGVTISRLDEYYWSRKYEGARRVSAN